jgi:hypothetical protein
MCGSGRGGLKVASVLAAASGVGGLKAAGHTTRQIADELNRQDFLAGATVMLARRRAMRRRRSLSITSSSM